MIERLEGVENNLNNINKIQSNMNGVLTLCQAHTRYDSMDSAKQFCDVELLSLSLYRGRSAIQRASVSCSRSYDERTGFEPTLPILNNHVCSL